MDTVAKYLTATEDSIIYLNGYVANFVLIFVKFIILVDSIV
jgi:hypothetical protein